ncbi:MAG: MBL fold metallo-hydrolase [Chloroflexi bacterium]|nr:MBL fold metallo-hydrolase [Chloroflexota bacterium]
MTLPTLTFVGHSTVLVEIDGVQILTDPILRQRIAHLHRAAPPVAPSTYRHIDVALISHLHHDHLDVPSLRLLPRMARVVVPRGAAAILRHLVPEQIVELGVGESFRVGGVEIVATPANHSGNRVPFGPRVHALGYLIRGSQQIYFAGDTDLFHDMTAIAEGLDAALLPVWGWGPTLGPGHLDPRRAAQALTLLHPRVAVPIHWGTLHPIGLGWPHRRFLTDPPQLFARDAAELAPAVHTRIVQPGHGIVLPPRDDRTLAPDANWLPHAGQIAASSLSD